MDAYLKKFTEFCRDYFKQDLIAIILYGSRAEGYSIKNSDYDVFVIVRKKRNEKGFRKTLKKFKKITLQYFEDINGLWKLLKSGHWSVYFVLFKTGKIVYLNKNNKVYLRFKNKLKNFKSDKDKIRARYTTTKYKYELREAQKLLGYNFVKWIYSSIRKRLCFISYSGYGKSNFNFLQDLARNKDLFSKQEIKNLKILHKKTYKRDGRSSKKQRKEFLSLFKKTNELVLKICTIKPD